MDLFSQIDIKKLSGTPLAERLRPADFSDVYGQPQVVKQLQTYLASSFLPSLILWGPPGTGKTSLASLIAKKFEAEFVNINAVESGAKALRDIGEAARMRRRIEDRRTVLFVDEIHRFNKSQQDILLPFVESGDLTLIGATTENPSYELNRALLSRCRLLILKSLAENDLKSLLEKAIEKINFENQGLTNTTPPWELNAEIIDFLVQWCDGDARRLILSLEELHVAQKVLETALTLEQVKEIVGKVALAYDKNSDQHYQLISGFIKSMRGSDVNAALYYLARMLEGGEDIHFICRRMIIFASEDIGNADPRALQVAVSTAQAVEIIGMPEAEINISQAVCYLASAPKSNRSYLAIKSAKAYVQKTGSKPVATLLQSPRHPQYKYPHDFPKAYVEQNHWPEGLKPELFYEPSEVGFEKQIKEYQKWQKS